MRFSIVCPDEHIQQAREEGKSLISSHVVLTTPLSKTGEMPQTHWFCTCYLTEEGFRKFKDLQKNTSIYQGPPSKVLKDLDLKIIR
jgi:hypothetical protein